jgi:hypothetical protein
MADSQKRETMNNRQISAKVKADMKKANVPFDWTSRVFSADNIYIHKGSRHYGNPADVVAALKGLGYTVTEVLLGYNIKHPDLQQD